MGTGLFHTPHNANLKYNARMQRRHGMGRTKSCAANRAKGNANRQRIIDLLASDEGETLSVAEIAERVGLSRLCVYKHIKWLHREMGE